MTNLHEEYKGLSRNTLDSCLIRECRHGDLDRVKYLLTVSKAYIHAMDEEPLHAACVKGHLEVVKYLLTSPDLEEKADLNANTDYAFKFAMATDRWDILKYFIFDLNIERSSHIDEYLSKVPNEQVISWFELRELNKILQNELTSENSVKKKVKL